MLTVKQMRAAIFAQNCDKNTDFISPVQAARFCVDIPYNGENQIDTELYDSLLAKAESEYNQGKEILEKYTLRFDHRSTFHTMSNGRIPGQDDGIATLRCEAGYIACSQAYDTAIFNLR